MSVDELFKKPSAPTGQKRKLEPIREPSQVYKTAKVNAEDHARRRPVPIVEDAPDEDDIEAGPEMPLGEEREDDAPDDEGGRFFGGGINEDNRAAMEYLNKNEQDDALEDERYDAHWLRKTVLNFEKKISRNAELRAKFENNPSRFIESEAELDREIRALSVLTDHTELYPEFAKLGCCTSLVSLLAHDNTDIAIDATEIISELVGDDAEAEPEQWKAVVTPMLESDLLDLLHQNLLRLNETLEADRDGIYRILELLESLASDRDVADQTGHHKSLVSWLQTRAGARESNISQNKQYAAEVLAILLQSSSSSRARFIEGDGIDAFLQLASTYRSRDPEKGTEDEEYFENIFDCLTCTVESEDAKQKFLDAEGIELCLIMIKGGKMSKDRALRLLDHLLGGRRGGPCCVQLVEAAGLKPLFAAFMKKQDGRTTEHILGIISSMLRCLPLESAPRIRLMAKFLEKGFEKLHKLFEMREEASTRLANTEKAIEIEKESLSAEYLDDMEDEWLSRKLDGGLFTHETIHAIIAWLIVDDTDGPGVRSQCLRELRSQGASIRSVSRTIQVQAERLDLADDDAEDDLRDMLETLQSALSVVERQPDGQSVLANGKT